MVRAKIDLITKKIYVLEHQIITTKKTSKKQVRVSSDCLQRSREIHGELHSFLTGCKFVIAEVPHGSQSAPASRALGIAVGILASIGFPIIEVTAREVKQSSVGKNNASKQEMIEWAMGKHPEVKWKMNKAKGTPTNDNEHIADAIASIYAGMNTQMFKLLTIK
jgi:Holliday junction resolvasome RuvABC endonuclease subunit